MTAGDPRVGVVVLNWNAAWLTARCIRALLATEYPADRLDIVVADNASIDGSLERLRHDLPGVRYLANEANLGFAEGCNRAVRALAPDVDIVALVNNDAVVSPGWLRPLVQALAADPGCGAACPKMLLETPFFDVEVEVAVESLPARLVSVHSDGIDVTGRCVMDGVDVRVDPLVPWSFVRTLNGPATVSVPIATVRPRRIEIVLDESGPDLVVDVPAGAPTVRRINCTGTELTPWGEGVERRFGEPDRADLGNEEVTGWSGGAVALRRSMLDEIGLFDPRFFAYYEDTDLAWRSRRAGWHTTFVAESVVDHLHGGSGGSASGAFFFLNYRNWLWTNLRNGDARRIVAAVRRAWHYSWPYTRRNVVGRVRRLQRPDMTITAAWGRVLAGVAEGVGPIVAARGVGHAVGREASSHVRSRFMPASSIPTPRHWPGGPRIVYVDVSETLRSGWRAGIQRVTCQIIANLPADRRLQLVPLVWSPLHGRFRRLTGPETASLFEPTGTQQPRPPGRPQPTWRRRAGHVGRLLGLSRFARAGRHKRAIAAEPPVHRELLLDRLEPGAVFFDLDAAWNLNDVDAAIRFGLLDASGVTIVQHLYDLLPIDRPEWFEPNNARLFARHVEAHHRRASLVIANSQYTADAYRAWCARSGGRTPDIEVVPLGADGSGTGEVGAAGCEAAERPDRRPFLLMVGTIEPRKNHEVVLDAMELLRQRHPELRLIVVGRAGWRPGAAVERLAQVGDDRIVWRTDVGDAELDSLYRGALVVVAPSLSEGFGLPVVEALRRGVPVIAASAGALAEVGGDAVDRFDPTDAAALAELVARHLDDDAYGRRMRERATEAPVRSWATVAAEMADLLVAVPAGASAARQSPL